MSDRAEILFNGIANAPVADIPAKVPASRYNDVIEHLVKRWTRLPVFPIAIYQIGQVKAPGISDLDFVLVFQDGQSIDWSQFQPASFPDWVQQLFSHPPYCCTESTWSDLPAWFPIFSIGHLWGSLLEEPAISDVHKRGVALGLLVDYLTVKMPRDLLCIAAERPIKLRVLLGLLHSLKYISRLAEQAGIKVPQSSNKLVVSVDSLRLNWHDSDFAKAMERLAILSREVCLTAGQQIALLDDALSKTIGLPSGANFNCGNPSSLFWFKSPWLFSNVLVMTAGHKHKECETPWINPYSFLQVMEIYADECPRFGKYLRTKGCKTELLWNGGKWDDGLRYHARAMTSYREQVRKIGVPPEKYIALGYLPHPFFYRLAGYAKRFAKGEVGVQDVLRKTSLKLKKSFSFNGTY
jgi:hypothetical protein